MKLALTIQTPEVEPAIPVALLSGAFEEKLAKAGEWGAEGVELMTVEPATLDAGAIRGALRRHGLSVAAIGSGALGLVAGLNLLHVDPQRSALAAVRLCELIRFAAALGAPLVTIGGFRGWARSVGAGGREQLVERLREGAVEAGALGVRMALEPLNRYETDLVHTAEQGLALLDEVGEPALGLLLDTFHVNIEESSWSEPFRRVMAAGRLWHVHLGDNNRLSPGRGLIDFRAIIETLRGAGYVGYLSAEHLALPDPDTAARLTLDHLRSLLRE